MARTESSELYPICIIQDRYRGSYSGGLWLAVANGSAPQGSLTRWQLVIFTGESTGGPSGSDPDAMKFWSDSPDWIASANSPNEAVAKLIAQKPSPPLRHY